MQVEPNIEAGNNGITKQFQIKGQKEDVNSKPIDDEGEEPRLYASKGEVLQALDEAFKSDPLLYRKLKSHAAKWLLFYTPGKKVEDEEITDIVTDVVRKLIEVDRKWCKETTPKIENLLLMVITSETRNKLKKKKKPFKRTELYNRAGEYIGDRTASFVRACLREDFEDTTLSDQVELWITELRQKFETKDDTIAYCVLDELLNIDRTEIKRPEDYIAVKLGITLPEVINAIRRIRRNIHSIISKKNII